VRSERFSCGGFKSKDLLLRLHLLRRKKEIMDESKESTSSSKNEVEEYESNNHDRNLTRISSHDEEKEIGHAGMETSVSTAGEPSPSVRSRGQRRRSQDSRSLRTTRSHQSRAGGDGYTCFDAEPDTTRPNNPKQGVVTEQPYLVTWDGDADPENPRSMSNLRRWTIVLICSASSLCV
jgi:hypothetical protein